MALENLGDLSNTINRAFELCHDLILTEMRLVPHATPFETVAKVAETFKAREQGCWSVHPCLIDNKPAVQIKIAVG